MKSSTTTALILFLSAGSTAWAHDDHCTAIKASVEEAGFSDSVAVTCSGDTATLSSDTYPDHTMMTGIVGTNEQVPVPAEWAAPVLLNPAKGSTPMTRDAALGVAVNGVPIYDYTAGGEMSQSDLHTHQHRLDTVLTEQLDECGGHAGRGDDYHYHAKPTCMIEQMANKGDDAIIGWGFDGYPIYGDRNPDGSTIAALDVCNGQDDDVFGYRYHTSPDAPYILQCLMGVVPDFDRLPRVRPLTAVGASVASGKPPRGGVDDLVFTQDADGTREMTYTYQGQDYFIRYSPSGRTGCFDFETKTITNSGNLVQAEMCR